MKNLYVVKNDNNQKVTFSVVQIHDETETEYILNTDLCDLIEHTGFSFPKNKLNVSLPNGFVTDNINNKKLKKELERIYTQLDEIHREYIEHHTMFKKINDNWYNTSLEEIEKIKNNKNK